MTTDGRLTQDEKLATVLAQPGHDLRDKPRMNSEFYAAALAYVTAVYADRAAWKEYHQHVAGATTRESVILRRAAEETSKRSRLLHAAVLEAGRAVVE